MPSYLVGVVVFFKPLYHIFIVMFVHRKILKPREMVSRSALAYLHIRWNDLPFRRVEKISEKIWQQGKSLKVQSLENIQIVQDELPTIPHVELSCDGQQLHTNETYRFIKLFFFSIDLSDQLDLKS